MAGSGERGGAQPPARAVAAGDLQPQDSAGPASLDSTRAALTVLHETGFADAERLKAERAVDRLARLQADRDVVERLREGGFEGKEYEVLKASLAGYGVPVMLAWIRRREIYRLTYEHGRPVDCPDEVKEHLAQDVDDRRELAMDVVAHALEDFREHALVRGVWDPCRGASLTTFFAGAAVRAFPNRFRAWAREYAEGRHMRLDDVVLDERLADDPADRVILVETLEEALTSAGPVVGHALAERFLRDTEFRDIAPDLGFTEAALIQRVYRWRKDQRKPKGQERGTDD